MKDKLSTLNILLLSFLFFNNLYAAKVTAEGRFQSIDEDDVSFVKVQLLHSAYQNAFNKEIVSMGLDRELFWESF